MGDRSEQLHRRPLPKPANWLLCSPGRTEGWVFPHELPVWGGDAIHNLASALDYIWSGLARQADPDLATRAHFPRHETRQNLIDMVSKSPVAKAFPKVEGMIIDQVKPYKDGNFPLWAVGKLDNIDKHRLFFAAMSIAKLGKFRAVSEDGSIIDLSYATVQTHGPELTIGFSTPFKLNDDVELSVDIVFNEPEVLPPVSRSKRRSSISRIRSPKHFGDYVFDKPRYLM